MLLEFTGRRTGCTIKVPVNMNLVDGIVVAFSAAPWRYNFAGGAAAKVTHRGQSYRTRGTLVSDEPSEMGLAVRGRSTPADLQNEWAFGRRRGTIRLRIELAALGPALGTSVVRFELSLPTRGSPK